jgi:hypothetical protein
MEGERAMAMLLTERWAATTAAAAEGPDDIGITNEDGASARELLAEMAALIRDTRPYLIVSSAVTAAVLVGLAVEAAVVPVRGPGPGAVAAGVLFAGVALCLLRTLTLIVLAGLPLGQALSQHRVASGAPLDPRAPWASVPRLEAPGVTWGWNRAYLLLSQARFRAERIQAATTWALVTAAAFLAFSAVLLLAR